MNLKDYIQGNRKGADANRLERQAMSDPFLQEALDGFDAVGGDHLSAIESLEKEIAGKTERKKSRAVAFRWQMLAVAASVAILLGLSGLFFLHSPITTPHFQTAQELSQPAEPQFDKTAPALAAAKDKAAPQEIIPLSQSSIAYVAPKIADAAADMMVMEEENSVVNSEVAKVSEQVNQTRTRQTPKGEKITGVVTDDRGEPLIGATVAVEGTNIGTVTDFDGKYELTIPPDNDAKITAKSLGFQPAEVPKQDFAKIQLTPDMIALEAVEAVGVGSGTARRADLSGAVGSASTKNKRTSEETMAEKSAEPILPFGKEEFLAYFEKNRRKDICADVKLSFQAEFSIDKKGAPIDVKIESNCEAFEQEFRTWLKKSPEWTDVNSKVQIRFP